MPNPQRQSMLCPNCGKLISRSETRCPHCGLQRPSSWLRSNVLTAGLGNPRQLIYRVMAVNIVMYVISLIMNPTLSSLTINPLQFLAPDSRNLLLLGMTGTVPIDQFGRWWSLVSANYLHGGVLHIFFNMAAFRQLAPLVISEYGAYRMFVIYTIGGVIGFGVSYLAGVSYTIGASAAVCSLIGAILYYGKSRGGVYGQAIYRQVGAWAVGLFIFGLLVPGINNWGHGGGMIGGALLGFALGYRERSRERLTHKILAGVCAGATVAILCWALITGIIYRVAG
jgi:rhomboid protease GluP